MPISLDPYIPLDPDTQNAERKEHDSADEFEDDLKGKSYNRERQQ
jgi:hypothetical protein